MESFVVLKLKYGEIIRRFRVKVLDNNKLDLNITALRAGVYNLFDFSSDTDFTMTYIDEDGDKVTLANDDDLDDMMSQDSRLLRMNVHLRNEKNNQFHDRLDGSSTSPMPAAPSRTGGGKEAVSQLLDAASKALVTSSALAEFSKSLLGLAELHVNSDVQSSSVPEPSTQNVATESSVTDPSRSAYKDSKIINRGSAAKARKNIRVDAPTYVHPTPLPSGFFAPMCEPYFSPTHLDNHIINPPFFSGRHPFSGVPPMATGPFILGMEGAYPPIYNDGYVGTMVPTTQSLSHKGVMCGGCGARPITGLRFKCKVKDNFDLCSVCFSEMGNEAEYIRIAYPISSSYPRKQAFNHGHSFPDPQKIDNTSRKQTTLNSCFVADVNVLDDTVMPPSTPFTKIWRMRNTGSSNWPRGTKLEWFGGVKFGLLASFEIKVPAHGLPVGQEIDVAVEFISPPLSGRFPSYWILTSPSGQRFGELIWVIIQVDRALERSGINFSQALDLNLPPTELGSGDLNGHEDVENNSTPAVSDGHFFSPPDPSFILKPVKPDCNLPVSGTEQHEQHSIVSDKIPAATSAKEEDNLVSNPKVSASSLSSGKVGSNNHHDAKEEDNLVFNSKVSASSSTSGKVGSNNHHNAKEEDNLVSNSKVSASSSSSGKVSSNNHHNEEETLLKRLVDMGFKQTDLNKKVLKMTGYDLEKTVDELCGVADWDPMIQDLEEMVGKRF